MKGHLTFSRIRIISLDFKSLQELPCILAANKTIMEITTEKTGYMLVNAWDSRGSGTDFAIIRLTDRLSNQIDCALQAQEVFRKNSNSAHLIINCGDCEFAEIEKLNEELFKFIEQSTEDDDWKIQYINEELYDAIYEICRIADIEYPDLRIIGDELIFQLFSEGGSEGYFLEFCTHYLPVAAF